jgi:hypothetical protein
MPAVSQPGTRVSAPPRMSSQSPGTKLIFRHEAPLDVRSPRLADSTAPTIGRPESSHYRPRPFPFHPDVSRSPRATLISGAIFLFVTGRRARFIKHRAHSAQGFGGGAAHSRIVVGLSGIQRRLGRACNRS